MSRMNIGDKVIVRATNENGVIKGREIIQRGDGTFDVQYIVKLGEGWDNWMAFSKRELQRNVANKPKKNSNISYAVADANDGYKVTVSAILQKSAFEDMYQLKIGYAICNPNDEYNERFGEKLAKHRAIHRPYSRYVSLKRNDFSKDIRVAIAKEKAEHIAKNIKEFVR